ncbi:hypothetical protein PCANC_01094 [Puccinia coronata f. sp. avenae]|uniref:Uncharacterized protein n=1 Tax=Puccinia coronata f. sp. avenae TaxID=200324 RepID=A0A2N5V5R4_9BASI|nr:hypothetical protein PCASD_03101 [Puccinia coronata f. sp. avenae]PLW57613.1 hypothetical protein PCANC_01094 [Puccinia coronata f. sp. avenae]
MAAPTAIVNPMAALMAIVNPMAALRASDGHHQPNGPSDGHCNYPMVVRADARSEKPFGCSTPRWPPAQWPLTTQWLPPRRLRHSMAALSGHRGNWGMDLSNQYSISVLNTGWCFCPPVSSYKSCNTSQKLDSGGKTRGAIDVGPGLP